jgi:carboxymethylenebutenolidase
MGEANPSTPPVAPITYPPPQQISPHLTLQPPLSRRGKGPGLIIILDHYALIEPSEKHLDPPPLQKWAEEGFAVVQVLVPGKVEDGGEFPLERALEVLKKCEGCVFGKGVGVICETFLLFVDCHLNVEWLNGHREEWELMILHALN